MTTASWVGFLDNSNDAGFRAWVAELIANITGVGIVQTADTGQINTATVTRPAANTVGGYSIFRFVDSTIYFKLEYGSNSSQTVPQLWITAGTGSNGSGTLTGQLSTRTTIVPNITITSTVTNYTSAVCRIADAFSLSWKEGYASAGAVNGTLLCIGKTVDGTGAATTTGYAVLHMVPAGSPVISIQGVRIASTATTYTDDGKHIAFPGDPSASTVQSGNTQAYQISFNIPEVVPFAWACGAFTSEAARGTSFAVAMVGAASHTYRSPGQLNGTQPIGGGYSGSAHTVPVVYE